MRKCTQNIIVDGENFGVDENTYVLLFFIIDLSFY